MAHSFSSRFLTGGRSCDQLLTPRPCCMAPMASVAKYPRTPSVAASHTHQRMFTSRVNIGHIRTAPSRPPVTPPSRGPRAAGGATRYPRHRSFAARPLAPLPPGCAQGQAIRRREGDVELIGEPEHVDGLHQLRLGYPEHDPQLRETHVGPLASDLVPDAEPLEDRLDDVVDRRASFPRKPRPPRALRTSRGRWSSRSITRSPGPPASGATPKSQT